MSKNAIKNVIVLVVVAGYLMLPTDIINDVIPVLGQADDTIVAIAGMLAAMRQIGAPRG